MSIAKAKDLMTTNNAGFNFSRDRGDWVAVALSADALTGTEPVDLGRPLRLATLNCLHDIGNAERLLLLQHCVRYDAILRELLEVDADIIGLNEVTVTLLKRLLEEEWVRDNYTASAIPDDGRCSCVSSTVTGSTAFGNLLLSRIKPISVMVRLDKQAKAVRSEGREERGDDRIPLLHNN
jgi:endonuclease/exonuclease/phosphatase family metal-dependent hydrolase